MPRISDLGPRFEQDIGTAPFQLPAPSRARASGVLNRAPNRLKRPPPLHGQRRTVVTLLAVEAARRSFG